MTEFDQSNLPPDQITEHPIAEESKADLRLIILHQFHQIEEMENEIKSLHDKVDVLKRALKAVL